jgi:hypothetical protein
MKKNISFLLLILSLCSSGCLNSKPDIGKLWFYTFSNDSSIDRVTLTPANFLEIRPDKSFTSDLGKFHSGHWILRDQQLLLNDEEGTVDVLLINDLRENEMQIQVGHSNAANFDGLPVPKIENDPFSKSNNLWRIIARNKESDTELKKRLRDHCRFWVAYFEWALETEQTTVDVRSTPTPIKIYGNGFAIKPFNELPVKWIKYFYDSADCVKANDMLEEIVKTHTIAWAHTDSKYKMFISAFQQMQQFLK